MHHQSCNRGKLSAGSSASQPMHPSWRINVGLLNFAREPRIDPRHRPSNNLPNPVNCPWLYQGPTSLSCLCPSRLSKLATTPSEQMIMLSESEIARLGA
jgi:hypothetical protein